MPKISDEKREARKAQILEAAWVCFQRKGLHAATMDDIIDASGLSAGAVYSYFSSKDALILSAVTASLSGLADLISKVLRKEPLTTPIDIFRLIVAAIDGFAARDGYDLKRIALLGWSEAQHNDGLRAIMDPYYRNFRRELSDAVRRAHTGLEPIDQQSADDIAVTLLSLTFGYVVQSSVLRDVPAKQIGRGLAELGRTSS